ncbi:MAG: galactose mutarotase [Hespellia sp.]|nr:galactose mutarotase [Hespellia sp.]
MLELAVTEFGTTVKKEKAQLFTLTNENGMSISLTNYGAILVKVIVPDAEGNPRDVVLGYDDVSGYETDGSHFGAIVGRNANRIGGAQFEINGVTYELDQNDNGNNLHSGRKLYGKRIWQVRNKSNQKITFTLHSADGDQGYPGALDVEVTYELFSDNTVKISYFTTPSMDTIINMTNHSYFNLNGQGSGDILGHEVMVEADYFTRADEESIPTGELTAVAGTPMDFNIAKPIGRDIDTEYEAIRFGLGYDHNWVLKKPHSFRKVAEAVGEQSGIVMEVYTDLPGMQLYSGNFLDHVVGKDGVIYDRRHGLCFETQYFPDAVHHENFESTICNAGENYQTSTAYKFLCKKL